MFILDQLNKLFKKRHTNHEKSFNLFRYRNDPEISKKYWRIKSFKRALEMKWSIVRKIIPYNIKTKQCWLSICE